MKIIKKKDVSGWVHRHTCSNCESELEVEASDLKHIHYAGDYREAPYDTFLANCAVCMKSFTISSDKIPKLVRIEAARRAGFTGELAK